MEGAGHFSPIQDIGPEALQEPVNLLQTYGENIVTLFGVTASLNELAKMCPVDLNDPLKLDSVNSFVAKAANEAGMEIKPEHEGIFSKEVEKTGAERKFVVAAESKSPSPEAKAENATAEQQDKSPAVRPEDVKTVKSLNTKEQEISMREAEAIVPASIIAAIRARQIQEIDIQEQSKPKLQGTENIVKIQHSNVTDTHNTSPNQVKKEIATKAVLPVKIKNITKSSVDNHLMQIDSYPVQELVVVDSKQGNIAPPEYRTEPRAESVIDDFFVTQEIPVNEITQIKGMNEFVQEDFDRIFDQMIENLEHSIDAPADTVEIIEPASPGANDWGELLFEEPDVMLDDFVLGLENFAAQMAQFDNLHPNVSVDNNDLESETNSPKIENSIAPIFQLVAEKLTLLEYKTEATEQLQSIIGAIHGIRILEERGADPAQIELVKEQLIELSAELFQQLGIEYDEKMVKLFVWTLLRPEFVPLKSRDKSYKQLGTHESKQEPSQYFDPSQPDRNPGHYVLGGLAVLYTTVLGDLRNLQLV